MSAVTDSRAVTIVRVPRIYTRTGDDGTTGLLYGKRVPKDHPTIEANGAVDEAQAAIGVARAETERGSELDQMLVGVERDMWVLMAELATAPEDRPKLEARKTLVTKEMVQSLGRADRRPEGAHRRAGRVRRTGPGPAVRAARSGADRRAQGRAPRRRSQHRAAPATTMTTTARLRFLCGPVPQPAVRPDLDRSALAGRGARACQEASRREAVTRRWTR